MTFYCWVRRSHSSAQFLSAITHDKLSSLSQRRQEVNSKRKGEEIASAEDSFHTYILYLDLSVGGGGGGGVCKSNHTSHNWCLSPDRNQPPAVALSALPHWSIAQTGDAQTLRGPCLQNKPRRQDLFVLVQNTSVLLTGRSCKRHGETSKLSLKCRYVIQSNNAFFCRRECAHAWATFDKPVQVTAAVKI